MNEIKMIPIGDLEHHPDNPRADLGDVSELGNSDRQDLHYYRSNEERIET